MNTKAFLVMLFIAGISDTAVILQYTAKEHFYNPYNVTRSTVSGIAAYRSSLTLDWLAAEDIRQRELAIAFETDAPVLKTVLSSDCMSYSRPSPGKIGRLMLELLKNLEGDDGIMVPELIQVLIRSKQLVETSILETEPNLDSLVKTPGLLIGEPHITFPRILAVIWMLVTDPSMTRKYGWCPINKVNSYLVNAKPNEVAKQMRSLEIVVARARFIMEEFIQSITPPNIYQKKTNKYKIKCQSLANDLDDIDPGFTREDTWMFRNSKQPEGNEPCLSIHPSSRDIVKRFQAILTYFDKDHSNSEFLHKYRATLYGMSEGEDFLDKEAAFYGVVLTPLVFFQNYRDTWCLLERFHRSLRLFQISHPTEKRSALKLLQNFRAVNQKVRIFVLELPSPPGTRTRSTTSAPEFDEEEFHDKKDIRFLKELIKNLG